MAREARDIYEPKIGSVKYDYQKTTTNYLKYEKFTKGDDKAKDYTFKI